MRHRSPSSVPLTASPFMADGAPTAGVMVRLSPIGQTAIGRQLTALLAEREQRAEDDWAGAVVHIGRPSPRR